MQLSTKTIIRQYQYPKFK